MDTVDILVPQKKEKIATAILDLAIHGNRIKSYKKKKHKNGVVYSITHDGNRETQAMVFRGLKVGGGMSVTVLKENKSKLTSEATANLVTTTRNTMLRNDVEDEDPSEDDEEVRRNHKYGNNQFYQRFYNESIEMYEAINTYQIKNREEMGKLIKYLRNKCKLTDQDFTLNGNPIDTVRARSIKAKQAINKFYGPSKAHKMQVMSEMIDEKTLSEPELKKREDIVKSMKKNKKAFQTRYGDDWKSVMYATATKHAKANT